MHLSFINSDHKTVAFCDGEEHKTTYSLSQVTCVSCLAGKLEQIENRLQSLEPLEGE